MTPMCRGGKDQLVIAEKIYAIFDQECQRTTRPRRMIADRLVQLAQSGQDFSIDDLWQDLRQQEPHLGRATVYRSVEMLVNASLLDRIDFADGTHRYRVCGGDEHHHHLTCTACHRVVDVDICIAPELFAQLSKLTNFSIEGHSLTLYGHCAVCRGSAS
jgi:Fur family ferric uptake transcriptional regulator